MKKLLCILLSAVLLLGLCACGNEQTSDQPQEPEIPELIYGTWYAMPDVTDIPVEINRDGICSINGETWTWQVGQVEDDWIVLVAGEGEDAFEIEFKYLQTNVPVLAVKHIGWAVKDPELWNFMTEWYSEEMKSTFVLTLYEMQETGCEIQLKAGTLIVETPEGYTLNITPKQCVVTDPEGNSTVYVPIDGGMGGSPDYGDFGDDADAAMAKYAEAMEDLEQVLTLGYMHVKDGNVSKRVHGSEAIEKLYHTFVSLENYVDVSEQLLCIQKVDNVLVKRNSLYPTGAITKTYRYDAFGGIERIYEDEAVASGNYLCFGYATEGKANALTVCGVVSGVPVMDENGKIQALKVTSTSGKEYTATVTYDKAGNVTRVDVPFSEGWSDEETQYRDVYDFLYNDNGQLIQYTLTHHGEFGEPDFYNEHGYFKKSVTEYYYDAANRVTKAITHISYTDSLKTSAWDYNVTRFAYNAAGQLSKVSWESGAVFYPTGADVSWAYQAIFKNTGFVDSVGKDLFGTPSLYLETPTQMPDTEYEYGSIYIFQTEE